MKVLSLSSTAGIAAILLAACGGAGSAGVAGQGAMPQPNSAYVQQGAATQSLGSRALAVAESEPAPPVEDVLMAGTERAHKKISSPIIDDHGRYPGGPIIVGKNNGDAGTGVEGIAGAAGGFGLMGLSKNAASTGTNIGVYGDSIGPGGYGVYGYSKQYIGVYGVSSNGSAFGGYFANESAPQAVGLKSIGTGNGILGESTNGNGILGESTNGNGVQGETTFPSKASGGFERAGVFGEDLSTDGGVFDAGVAGTSINGIAVYGTSGSGDGVHGVTSSTNGNSGTSGISTSLAGSAHGVYGRSSNGQGVYGTSSSNNGVEGVSSGSGASGVAGIQRGTSSGSGDGGYFESADTTNLFQALEAKADSSNTYIFEGFNASTNGLCTIDYNAALACTGGATFKKVRTRHANANGQHVLAYAAESATATIEDVGTARMVGGVANVRIDPAFASVTDHKSYYVFLTPLADTRGLYVSMKTVSAFQVRETEHGSSTLEFDYRIVAHPLDADNDRLPVAPAIRTPREGVPIKQ